MYTNKLFESYNQQLNEKINKDNIEINRAIANPNAGKNVDKIKAAGYEPETDSQGKVYAVKNPKNKKFIMPSDYNKDKKQKVDFKGRLDSDRKNNQRNYYPEDVPKSLKTGKSGHYAQADMDDIETMRSGISKNIKDYKKAVKDRDDSLHSVAVGKKDLPY